MTDRSNICILHVYKQYTYYLIYCEDKRMPILVEFDYLYQLPKMFKVRQKFQGETLLDVQQTVRNEMRKKEIATKLKPGMKVAVGVGSRRINNLALIVKTVIEELLRFKTEPFIISAMGSHGGGTEEGQREVLESYGITKENMGVEVITKVDVVNLEKHQRDLMFISIKPLSMPISSFPSIELNFIRILSENYKVVCVKCWLLVLEITLDVPPFMKKIRMYLQRFWKKQHKK